MRHLHIPQFFYLAFECSLFFALFSIKNRITLSQYIQYIFFMYIVKNENKNKINGAFTVIVNLCNVSRM